MSTTSYYSDAGSNIFSLEEEISQAFHQVTAVPVSESEPSVPKKSLSEVLDECRARCKAQARPKRKRTGQYTNSDPLIKFLRQRISRLNYALKVTDEGIYPELDSEKFTARYNKRRFGAALKNDQFHDHFA